MKIKTVVAIACFIVFLGVSARAQYSQLKMPLVQKDVCPFEGCMYGKWTAKSSLTVFETEGGASVAFHIKPGMFFTSIVGNVHISKAGLAIVQKNAAGFKKGDELSLLSYRGEGNYDLWYKKKFIKSDAMDVLVYSKVIYPSQMTWWVKVKLNDGRHGWLKLKNVAKEGGFKIKENIDGMDRFG